jgi:hypothetical protein
MLKKIVNELIIIYSTAGRPAQARSRRAVNLKMLRNPRSWPLISGHPDRRLVVRWISSIFKEREAFAWA